MCEIRNESAQGETSDIIFKGWNFADGTLTSCNMKMFSRSDSEETFVLFHEFHRTSNIQIQPELLTLMSPIH